MVSRGGENIGFYEEILRREANMGLGQFHSRLADQPVENRQPHLSNIGKTISPPDQEPNIYINPPSLYPSKHPSLLTTTGLAIDSYPLSWVLQTHSSSIMKFLAITSLLLSATAQAFLNGRCAVNGISGVCVSTASCSSSGGHSTPKFCPSDPPDIQCCTKTECNSGAGYCTWTDQCAGTPIPSTPPLFFIYTESTLTKVDQCPGPTNFKCCPDPKPPICSGRKRCIPPMEWLRWFFYTQYIPMFSLVSWEWRVNEVSDYLP